MADSAAPWAAPGPSAPPTRPQGFATAAPAAERGSAVGQALASRPAGAVAPGTAAKPARRTGTRPIPLRPLSVLEVIDAGVGSLRSSPRRVHLTALLVTAAICLLGFAGLWFFQHRLDLDIRQGSYTSTDFFGNATVYEGVADGTTNFGDFVTQALFVIVFSGMAATFTAGLYATSAQRYVDGLPPDPAAARAGYRGRIGTMAWLTLLISIPRLIMLGLSVVFDLACATNQSGGGGGLFVTLILIGVPVCLLFTALFAVALPALILERVSPGKAMRRTRRLSQGGIWRSAWTCLFTLLMTYAPIVLMAVYELHLRSQADSSSPLADLFPITYTVLLAAVIILTVPLRASTATMLYVDRRFRREGLDVRIAWARVAKETL